MVSSISLSLAHFQLHWFVLLSHSYFYCGLSSSSTQDLLQHSLPCFAFSRAILAMHTASLYKPSNSCTFTASRCCLLRDEKEENTVMLRMVQWFWGGPSHNPCLPMFTPWCDPLLDGWWAGGWLPCEQQNLTKATEHLENCPDGARSRGEPAHRTEVSVGPQEPQPPASKKLDCQSYKQKEINLPKTGVCLEANPPLVKPENSLADTLKLWGAKRVLQWVMFLCDLLRSEKKQIHVSMCTCVSLAVNFILCVWIWIACCLFLSAWRVLVVLLIKSVWEQQILIIYLGTALFCHQSWRTVLLGIKFLVDSCLFLATRVCHSTAFWPLLFLVGKKTSAVPEKPLHIISHFSRCFPDFLFAKFDY